MLNINIHLFAEPQRAGMSPDLTGDKVSRQMPCKDTNTYLPQADEESLSDGGLDTPLDKTAAATLESHGRLNLYRQQQEFTEHSDISGTHCSLQPGLE